MRKNKVIQIDLDDIEIYDDLLGQPVPRSLEEAAEKFIKKSKKRNDNKTSGNSKKSKDWHSS